MNKGKGWLIHTRAKSKYYSLIIWCLPLLLFKEMQTTAKISVSFRLETPPKKNLQKINTTQC